jgi:DNA-binding transcriptional regulator YhcF (GntR family)
MDLTLHELQVITRLRSVRVAELSALAAQFDLSTKTVQRALVKAGYFTSINRNGSFVTLKDVPQFDPLGLWSVDQVHFSKHGNLGETLEKLIEQAPGGSTLQELEQWVGTRAHNHLSHLVRAGKLRRFRLGKRVVYLSAGARQARHQEDRRRTMEQAAQAVAQTSEPSAVLPAGLEAVTVIHVLVKLLQTPKASPASVARSLQARHVSIRADQVRDMVDFYGLKKTTR